MDHGDGPGRADLQRRVRGPARRRARRRHGDLAQRLRPRPQRQRRRRQLRLTASADGGHVRAPLRRPGRRTPTTASCTRRCAATSPSTACCSAPRRSRPRAGKPYALSGRAALPEGSTVSIEAGGAVAATAKVGADGAFTASVKPRGDDDLHGGRRRRVRAARAGARARSQGQRGSVAVKGRRVLVDARGHAGLAGRDGRAPAATSRSTSAGGRRARSSSTRTRACASRSRAARKVSARVLLTASDGATELARSATFTCAETLQR